MGIAISVDTNDVNNIKIITFKCSISLDIDWFFYQVLEESMVAKIVLSCPNHSSTNSNKFFTWACKAIKFKHQQMVLYFPGS